MYTCNATVESDASLQLLLSKSPPHLPHVNAHIDAAQQKYIGTFASYGNGARHQKPIHLLDMQGAKVDVTQDVVAFATELMMAPASTQASAPGGVGSRWFGIDTLQDPMDAAAISDLLWTLKPDLVIEIGTECGGSAVFYAQMLKLMRMPKQSKLLTYDVFPVNRRSCPGRSQGVKSQMWKDLVAEGFIEPRIADVTLPAELAHIETLTSTAATVMIIDDGDHHATPLILHFELLAKFVTPGSVYLIQDTRLDRTCLAQRELRHRPWAYCADILASKGGPARAVRYLQCESSSYKRLQFSIDFSLEKWVYSQHPGGYLRRAPLQ